jgi:flagellar basal body-associated protein FliL
MIIVGLVLLLLAGAGLFYWKVVKPKDKLPSEADFFADDYLEESSEQEVD